MKGPLLALSALMTLTMLSPAQSDEAASQPLNQTLTKEQLAARYLGLNPANIHDGPFNGLYEVAVDMNVTYVTTDGRYMLRGDIIDLQTQASVTQARLATTRAEWLEKVDTATEIIFPAASGAPKYTIYVFTDVDCGYCRQFHREIAAANQLGVEVRYLSYPRTGPNTDSWHKAEAVWCSDDRSAALTNAKLGAAVTLKNGCTTTAVGEHYTLGQRLHLEGTPAVYTAAGQDVGGYLPPAELIARLEQLAALPKNP
jgi:thiol:disulfide interchange protein DsbC